MVIPKGVEINNYFFSDVVLNISKMASRNYSPYGPRSRKISSPLSAFSFLTSDKTKNFRISLWVVAVVLLGLSVFFSYTMYLFNKYSADEVRLMHPKLVNTVQFSGTTTGKVVLTILWVMFALTVLPIGAGEWYRSQQNRIL